MRLLRKIPAKVSIYEVYFVIISLLSYTFFREYLIVFSPVLVFLGMLIYKLKVTKNIILLCLITFMTLPFSQLLYGFYPYNLIVSISLIIPLLIFMLSSPQAQGYNKDLFWRFIVISSIVLILVDFTALVSFSYFAIIGRDFLDDSFVGIYGRSGLSMHTLSIMNFLYAIFYFFRKQFLYCSAFAISGLLCFFGTATLILALSIVIYLIIKGRFIRNFVKVGLITIIVIVATALVNSRVLVHYKVNLAKFQVAGLILDYEKEIESANLLRYNETPRKMVFFQGAAKRVYKDPAILLFGTGPGTYSSRVSFLLNGDYSYIPVLRNNFQIEPIFAKSDIYPLWNSELLDIKFMDGTRNKPWSSSISLLMEYGLIFSILFFLVVFSRFRSLLKQTNYSDFFLLSWIFLFILFLTDNYLEYPEVSIPIILMFKTAEIEKLQSQEDEA